MSKDNGGPVFPVQDAASWQGHGMTLRDYFAAQASEEDIDAQYRKILHSNGKMPDNWRVTARYMHADAMIAERNKQ